MKLRFARNAVKGGRFARPLALVARRLTTSACETGDVGYSLWAYGPQTVHCPGCQALVPAADINIAALVAKCGNCNRIFPLSIENLQAAGATKAEPALGCPGGVVREVGPGGELLSG